MLAILIMDKKQLSEEVINKFGQDMQIHSYEERNNLIDWLMANHLTKDKTLLNLLNSWRNSLSSLQRRAYWFYQARLRWMGKLNNDDTEELVSYIETNLMNEEPEDQWAMNLTAGWIGVYDERYRERFIKLGKMVGLYKDEKVSKGCTPNYLPEFIRIEVNKRQKND